MKKRVTLKWEIKKNSSFFDPAFILQNLLVLGFGIYAWQRKDFSFMSVLGIFILVIWVTYFVRKGKAIKVELRPEGVEINSSFYPFEDFSKFRFFPESFHPFFILFFKNKIKGQLEIDLPKNTELKVLLYQEGSANKLEEFSLTEETKKSDYIRSFLRERLEEEDKENFLESLLRIFRI